MNLLELISISPIADSSCKAFDTMAFDGETFYFSRNCGKVVYRYNQNLDSLDCDEIQKNYSSLCYDSRENCFWATLSNCNNRIFKLDASFCEFDFIRIKTDGMRAANIVGISYSADDTLIVTFEHGVVEIDKSGGQTARQMNYNQLYVASLSTPPDYLVAFLKNAKQYIALCSTSNALIDYEIIPNDYIIRNMALHAYNEDLFLYILAMKNRAYSYLMKFKFNALC